MSPSWENLDDFLSADEFATVGVVQFQDGGTRNVTGIFDDPFMDAKLGEYDLDTSRPRFLCKESALAGIGRGDQLTLGGKAYDIMGAARSTGDGMATLDLAET